MSKFSESSEMGHDVRREAQGERRASPPLDTLSPSPDTLLVTNGFSNQYDFTATTTPATPHQGPVRHPVFKWKEDWDFKSGPWGSLEGWHREKQRWSNYEARRQQRKADRDASNAIGISMHPDDAVHVEIKSKWPLAERHARCLQPFAAVGRCENAHDTPVAIPCRGAWHPRCRSQALFRLASVYWPDSRIYNGDAAIEVRKYVGSTASIITISRRVGPARLVTKEPERFAQARRALGKVVDRLSKREVILIRVDRLRLDETGTWHVDRHVLLQGTANLGRLKSALIVETGSAVEVVQRFLDLAGSTWFDDPVEETVARVLVKALSRRHRVEVFGRFKTLLRATDTERQCSECGAPQIGVEFLPTFAAPLVPWNKPEFEKAVSHMRRGPPMITYRTSLRAA